MTYQSWGRVFHYNSKSLSVEWMFELPKTFEDDSSYLAYGLGRSYGDSCLNQNGTVIEMKRLNNLIEFNDETGILTAEAGLSLGDILKIIVAKGWFIPVSPGTKFVTLGGAVANDIHGKNHHNYGTFGRHVKSMTLQRSNGEILTLSENENEDLYKATIGGLGLTGIIRTVTIQLIKKSCYFDFENIQFNGLEEFFKLTEESENSHEYTVSWVDCASTGSKLARGIFMRANHSDKTDSKSHSDDSKLAIPINFPSFALSKPTIKIFNELYFHKQLKKVVSGTVHYEPFLYPLDAIHNWNKIYGKDGFYQFQFVTPLDKKETLKEVFKIIADSGNGSF